MEPFTIAMLLPNTRPHSDGASEEPISFERLGMANNCQSGLRANNRRMEFGTCTLLYDAWTTL